MQTLSFLGTGHMGASLARALHASLEAEFLLFNRTLEKAVRLKEELGGNAKVASLEECLDADYLFLGVKPKDMDALLSSFPYPPKGIVVSMAAGISLRELSAYLPKAKLVRIMPNTPVAVSMGFTPYCALNLSEEELAAFDRLLRHTGEVLPIEEKDMDAYSVLSGSSPAYIDYYLDALIEAGTKLGLSHEDATKAVMATALGALELARETGKAPKELGKEVCSPGGSTIEGVNVLLDKGIYATVEEAVSASYAKNKKMK